MMFLLPYPIPTPCTRWRSDEKRWDNAKRIHFPPLYLSCVSLTPYPLFYYYASSIEFRQLWWRWREEEAAVYSFHWTTAPLHIRHATHLHEQLYALFGQEDVSYFCHVDAESLRSNVIFMKLAMLAMQWFTLSAFSMNTLSQHMVVVGYPGK